MDPSNAVSAAKNYFQFGSRHTGCVSGEAKNGGQIDDFRVYNTALTPEQVRILCAAVSGMVSVKTGARDDTTTGGNVTVFGTNLGAVQAYPTTWNRTTNASADCVRRSHNLLTRGRFVLGHQIVLCVGGQRGERRAHQYAERRADEDVLR
jgi:hypothetical protein